MDIHEIHQNRAWRFSCCRNVCGRIHCGDGSSASHPALSYSWSRCKATGTEVSLSFVLFFASLLESDHLELWALGADSSTFPIADYVFVTPVEVDSGGSYISHDILHNGRKKRSAQNARSSLHYRFSAFGQELHLELKPSAILSSHFIVQVLGKDGASETQKPEVQQCFYQGFIRNDSSSSVAVSTCAGLVSTPQSELNSLLRVLCDLNEQMSAI
ncbi:hypothetical protein P7K49_036781 [Saguinus oedipus]|uniref:Peptidase M12B propeptide domain-containing protein n=1 Tax=Saguinus oedipus TaxID=9490 RepID=A0ABQ9TL59_SAGOE|nr:hypothetical protein P7K49_036781 [Saguinus oedipus]